MDKAKKFLARRKANAENRLATIAQFQADAKDELIDMRDLIRQVEETVTSIKDVINANTGQH